MLLLPPKSVVSFLSLQKDSMKFRVENRSDLQGSHTPEEGDTGPSCMFPVMGRSFAMTNDFGCVQGRTLGWEIKHHLVKLSVTSRLWREMHLSTDCSNTKVDGASLCAKIS